MICRRTKSLLIRFERYILGVYLRRKKNIPKPNYITQWLYTSGHLLYWYFTFYIPFFLREREKKRKDNNLIYLYFLVCLHALYNNQAQDRSLGSSSKIMRDAASSKQYASTLEAFFSLYLFKESLTIKQ